MKKTQDYQKFIHDCKRKEFGSFIEKQKKKISINTNVENFGMVDVFVENFFFI